MPIEVSAIRDRRDSCTISLGGGASIVFAYLPIKVSELMERSDDGTLEQDAAGGTLADARLLAATQLVDLVAGWDVTQDGQPFPLEAEIVAETFDLGVLNRCIAGIMEHYATGKTSGELLSALGTGITSPKGAAESSPAGTANRASRRSANSSRSRSSAGSSRGRLRRIPSTTTSSRLA